MPLATLPDRLPFVVSPGIWVTAALILCSVPEVASAVAITSKAAPPGLTQNLREVRDAIELAKPRLPMQAKAKVEARSEVQAPKPRQFAVAIATDITPENDGSWETLQDGRALWRVKIASTDATSLNLAFGHLRLPAQAELYVYDAAGTKTHGPYAAKDLRNSQLWTPVVEGDAAVVEVVVPAGKRDELELQISQVNYGFAELSGPLMGKSASCQVDVACSTGDAWSDEARSVAVFTFDGVFSCSGTLMNNTALDQTPYFLTAQHCVETAEQAASTVFYWNYQASTCGGGDANRDQSQSGADLVAHSEFSLYSAKSDQGSDFALLKLWQKPDPKFNVYYAGWDRRDVAPSAGVVGIHHPKGDQKMIATSGLATQITTIMGLGDGNPNKLSFLLVPGWTQGTLEYGSSGSGLWNMEHRLVGHAMGTAATCERPGISLYGRLNFDWSNSTNPRYSLASHLDRAGSLAEVLDGLDPAVMRAQAEAAAAAAAANANSGGGSLAALHLVLFGLAGLVRKIVRQRQRQT